MNSACVTQPNPEDLILNNGEGKAHTEDSQTRRQGAKNQSLKKENDATTYTAFERDGGVKTAGESPLLASEEMGVVNAEREIPAGKRKFEVHHNKSIDEQDLSASVISDERTCDTSLCSQDLSPQNGNAINNHIPVDGCGSISSKMNTDSIDCESSILPSNSDQNVSLSRLAQSEGVDIDARTSSGNENVPSAGHHSVDGGTSNSMSNHSRGIETEVIVNQQSNGEISQSCAGEELNEKVTNMQISPVGEMTPTDSNQTSPRPSNVSDRDETSLPECELTDECKENTLDTKTKLQVHIPSSKGCEATCVENEISSPERRCPSTLELAQESTSPATIDITHSEEWEDASGEIPTRPQFFTENLTDLTPSPNSQQNSQSTSSWSSQRTLSVSSTPVEGSSTNSGSQERVSEAGVVQSVKGPVMTSSTVPDDKNNTPTRSRTSTATSLSTDDFSSNISIATDDLNDAIADCLVLGGEEDVGFEDVNLEHGELGHPPGASVVGSGAKPKKRGLGGFLTRNIFRKSLGKSSSHAAGAGAEASPGSPPGWKLFGRVPAKESMQRDHMQISEDFQKRGQTHPPTSSLTWKKRHTGLKEASSTTALILENRPEYLPAKNPEEEEKHKEEYTKMLKEAKRKN
ncbi:uncharacterized protein LOC589360 isoform X1 [Strongylocentrotus purpuratus]|uniref:Uncharacterized protein n=1 Tax=Strongylocentrotus purpuratus TaxID=7668 RepID=A0A7M7NUV2_STRPU|nr:uncharacterized protein LOC589360 isoform X1 [Strongylocentrotus purpuratus]